MQFFDYLDSLGMCGQEKSREVIPLTLCDMNQTSVEERSGPQLLVLSGNAAEDVANSLINRRSDDFVLVPCHTVSHSFWLTTLASIDALCGHVRRGVHRFTRSIVSRTRSSMKTSLTVFCYWKTSCSPIALQMERHAVLLSLIPYDQPSPLESSPS